MKSRILVVGLAAACSAAEGRTGWQMIVHPQRISGPGDSMELRVYARFGMDKFAFAGGEFGIAATDPYGSFFDAQNWLRGPGWSAGEIDGPSVTGIVVGQEHDPLHGVFANEADPILVWTGRFTTTDWSYHTIQFSTSTSTFDIFVNPAGDRRSKLKGFHEGENDGWVGVPAPGAAWMAAFGLLLGSRRRRGP